MRQIRRESSRGSGRDGRGKPKRSFKRREPSVRLIHSRGSKNRLQSLVKIQLTGLVNFELTKTAIASGGTVSVTLYDAAGNPLSANGLTLTRDVVIPTELGTVEVTPTGGIVVAKAFNSTNTPTSTDDTVFGIFVGTGLKDTPGLFIDDTLVAATDDGTQMPGADVAFYLSNLLWLNMSVGPASNPLNLSLNWMVPGDATGSVRLRGENWFSGGAIANLDDHPYVVWNNSTARMLIDQEISNHGRVL